MTELCVKCGQKPCWHGPRGNKNLPYCEDCQRQVWRDYKAAKRAAETKRACTKCGVTYPLTEEYFYFRNERGTFRQQCKTCYDKRLPRQSKAPRQRRTRVPASEPPAGNGLIKVLLVDHQRDRVQRFVVPVTSEKKLSDCRQAKRLIDFYRYTGHVIVEVE